MTDTGWIELPYPPSSNRYWRHWGKRVVQSTEARAYIKQVAGILAGHQPVGGDVALEVVICRPIKSGDLDNRLKVLQDSLRGLLFVDDKQVRRIVADLKESPRDGHALVRVREILP